MPLKNANLRGATESGIFRPNGQEANRIAKSVSPGLKFSTRPLETVILVSHLAGRQGFEFNVVLDIWRRHDDRLRGSCLSASLANRQAAAFVTRFLRHGARRPGRRSLEVSCPSQARGEAGPRHIRGREPVLLHCFEGRREHLPSFVLCQADWFFNRLFFARVSFRHFFCSGFLLANRLNASRASHF